MTGSVGVTTAAVTLPSDSEARSSSAAELRVVYLATAADTSCVSHDDDGRQHTVVSVGSSQHMVMDVDGSDSDDDSSTAVTRRSVTDVTATMLQRN